MNGENVLQKLFARGNSYWLTRFVILRLLGFVYAVAFLVAAQQLVPLVGEHGLTPAKHFLEIVRTQLGSRDAGMLRVPTLFWFGISDNALSIFSWIGFGLSLVVLGGYANAILLAVLWAMYMSIVHIGQIWYGYGWEIQLLETGFLSIFLCPLLDGRPFPKCRPPILVIWLFRWLGFRIMIGAGLIKLRGDPCWRDLTCLYYHYETQPIPGPISRYLHFAPLWFHKFEAAWNHFVELVVPWFSFGPRHVRHIAGALLITFQIFLIVSGNLSFLNYLTIIPFLACFDDTFLRHFLPRAVVQRAERAAKESEPSRINNTVALALSILVVYLSVAPVLNLVSGRQLM
ncbi:MAG: membrane protein, partial [Verrucomicrobia bacterium]